MKTWIEERWWRLWFIGMTWYAGFKISGGDYRAGLLLVGLLFIGALIYYCIKDALVFFFGRIRPTQNFNVNVTTTTPGHPDVEGTASRHPDPTRPSEEDWAGIITYRLESGRRRHK